MAGSILTQMPRLLKTESPELQARVKGTMKFCLGILCSMSVIWAGDTPATSIRDAAAKAVSMIQKSQKNWYAKQSCDSCHQQLLPALAFRAAREHGIPVDEPAAHADAAGA